MQKPARDHNPERLRDKAHLILKINYFSSVFSLIFGILCLFVLNIREIIPFVFFGFGILTLINTLASGKHK
ncbi:MAG: sensor histidine kinase, partial [Bacteroidota bacterium]